MAKVSEKFAGKMFRSGGAEYMEYRKQQLKESPEYQASLSKRKYKLLERLNSKK